MVNDITFSYASTPILEGIQMELADSEVLGVVGPNGAGKSTLIRCINIILKPDQGSILLEGEEIIHMDPIEIAKKLGYVPQTTTHTFPATVFDTVLMGRRPHIGWRSGEKDVKMVDEVLKLMEIEDLAMRDFNQLSGGQRQKVLIARALAQEAGTLLLDEPTSNLDIQHQLEVMEIIRYLVAKKGISAIMAVHDLNLALRYTDRVLIMKGGRIFDAGVPSEVLTPENIMSVYNVEAEVINSNGRIPYVVPIRSARANGPWRNE